MDVILKSVRTLIRQTMKECGIEHRSSDHSIWSRCFASTPDRSIEYDGPIYVYFKDFPIVKAVVYGEGTTKNELAAIDIIGLDINDPRVLDKFKDFLNQHISAKMKVFDHSKLYAGHDKAMFVKSETVRANQKPSRVLDLTWWQRLKMAWRLFRGKVEVLGPATANYQDFYWEQAILRHLHDIDQNTIKEIKQTIIEIEASNRSPERISATTAAIRTQCV